jgi:hypothetical protein
MKKQIWGHWSIGEGVVLVGRSGKKIPIRIMVQLPYDWHLTHNGNHTRKYWAKKRRK